MRQESTDSPLPEGNRDRENQEVWPDLYSELGKAMEAFSKRLS